jgi:hypothetical protein
MMLVVVLDDMVDSSEDLVLDRHWIVLAMKTSIAQIEQTDNTLLGRTTRLTSVVRV